MFAGSYDNLQKFPMTVSTESNLDFPFSCFGGFKALSVIFHINRADCLKVGKT